PAAHAAPTRRSSDLGLQHRRSRGRGGPAAARGRRRVRGRRRTRRSTRLARQGVRGAARRSRRRRRQACRAAGLHQTADRPVQIPTDARLHRRPPPYPDRQAATLPATFPVVTPTTPPRQLITSLYGLYARDEQNWLSVAALVRLMAELDVDAAAVRSSVSRLKKRNILCSLKHDGQVGYALSAQTVELLREGDVRIFDRPRATTDDGWLSVEIGRASSRQSGG